MCVCVCEHVRHNISACTVNLAQKFVTSKMVQEDFGKWTRINYTLSNLL